MEERKGLSLVGVIVTIICIVFIVSGCITLLRKVKMIATHHICGANLKGVGTAMIVYANNYDNRYPQLPGDGPWSKRLGFDYDRQKHFSAPILNKKNLPTKIQIIGTLSSYGILDRILISMSAMRCIIPMAGFRPMIHAVQPLRLRQI